jgi:hypothetical protein
VAPEVLDLALCGKVEGREFRLAGEVREAEVGALEREEETPDDRLPPRVLALDDLELFGPACDKEVLPPGACGVGEDEDGRVEDARGGVRVDERDEPERVRDRLEDLGLVGARGKPWRDELARLELEEVVRLARVGVAPSSDEAVAWRTAGRAREEEEERDEGDGDQEGYSPPWRDDRDE